MLIYLSLIAGQADRDKFELIYHQYRGLMFYTARSILQNDRDAEDMVHDAFVKIAGQIEKISDPVCPKTRAFVVIIVERLSINLYHAKRRKAPLSLEEENVNVPNPSRLDGLEQADGISRAIALLPARYRELLMLKYDSGFDDREIAKLLDMSAANVTRTIQRAKKKLQENLEREGITV